MKRSLLSRRSAEGLPEVSAAVPPASTFLNKFGFIALFLAIGAGLAAFYYRGLQSRDAAVRTMSLEICAPRQQWIGEAGVRLSAIKDLGHTEITVSREPVGINRQKSIAKVVGIHPEFDDQLDAEMVFVYEDADLDGHYENDLILYSSADNGKTWEPHPNSVVDPERNTITLDGIAHFSLWTAAPPPPAPGGVSASLQLWLKANEGATYDGSNNLTGWDDQSGSPKPETVIGTPTYVPGDAVNFNPSVRFDNTTSVTEYLDFAPFTPASFTKGHYFLVFKQGLFPTNQHMTGAVGFCADDQNFSWVDGHIYDSFGNNDQFAAVGTSPAQFNRDIFSMYDAKIRTSAPNFVNYFNGTQFSTRSVSPISFGNLSVKVGVCNNANLGFLRAYNGYIPETLLYNTDLSEDDRKRVETYLAVKYGLTMSHNYLSSAGTPTTIYDVSTHGNNIAGIGRDDASDLDQRQSKSIHPGALVTMGLGAIAADNASNPNAFGADMSFMIWGHNAGSITWQATETPANRRRLTREWKIAETGTVGTVKLRVPDNGSALTTKLPGEANNIVYLLQDADGDFSSGATETAMMLNGTDWETNVNFVDGTYFTFATDPIPTPGCVAANLKLWLKADDGTLSGDGSSVSIWNNSLGDGYNTIQASAGAQPKFYDASTANLVNYNPTLSFDGGDELYNNTRLFSNTAPYSMMAVAIDRRTNPAEVRGPLGLDYPSGDFPNLEFHTGGSSPNGWRPWSGVDGHFLNSTAPLYSLGQGASNQGGNIVGLTTNNIPGGSDNLISYVNGFKENTTISSNQATNFGNGIFVGSTGGEEWLGLIPEAIVYDRQLSDAEMKQVYSYLAIKYGITLTHDYVDGAGATIYALGSYGNNVAGIGRDDCQGLNQKQSRNMSAGLQPVIGNANQLAATNAAHTGNFSADKSFLLWGSDNGAATFGTAYAFSGMSHRLTRIWKTQETGTVGSVKVGVPASSFPGNASQHHLLVSNDQIFDNSDTKIAMTIESVGGIDYYTATTDFTSGQHFTFGAFIVSPGCVAGNLKLWVKADDGALTGDGSSVSTWLNALGDGYNVTQPTGGAQPKFYNTSTGNLVNFNPALSFDGGDELYNTTRLFSNTAPYSMLAVAIDRRTNPAEVRGPLGLHYPSGDWPNLEFHTGGSSLNGWRPYSAVGGHFLNSTAPIYMLGLGASNLGGNIVGLTTNNIAGGSSNLISYANGLKENTTLGSNQSVNFGDGVFVGSTGGEEWLGLIPEAIVYDRQLSDAEMQRIYSYLAIKYGIPLTHNYVNGAGATIYTLGSYGNNVGGIGREDCQGLQQKQSQCMLAGLQPVIGNANQLAATNAAHTGAFSADGSFLLWGSDNGAATFGASYAFSGMSHRITRIWKTQETGTVGSVKVGVAVSSFPGNASQIHLLVSNDATFDNADTKIAMSVESVGGTDYYTATTNFSSGQHFTFGAFVTAPGGVAGGLNLWMKGDAGVTGATDITAWTDQVNNIEFPRKNASNTLSETTLNFNTVINFPNAGDNGFEITNTHPSLGMFDPSAATGFSTFGAGFPSPTVNDYHPYISKTNGGTWDLGWVMSTNGYVTQTTSFVWGNHSGNGAGNSATQTFPLNQPFLATGWWDPAMTNKNHMSVNGKAPGTINVATTSSVGYPLAIGYAQGYGFNGKLGEVIYYNTNLDPTDRQKVNSYLAIRYGLTLDQTVPTNYLASDAAVIWNASTNTGYNNNIAGIGRDDASGMQQKQSQSQLQGLQPVVGNASQLAATNAAHTGNFSVDKSFLLWGSDNGAATFGTPYGFSGMSHRITRVWKTQETGTVGSVKVGVLKSDFPGSATQIHLLVSADQTFDNSDTKIAMTLESVGGVDYYTATTDFTSTQHFTFGAYLVTPGCVAANLLTWYKATDGVNGNPVSSWQDLVNGYNVIQNTASHQPAFQDVALNFNPALLFDGSNDHLEYTAGRFIAANSGGTMFGVATNAGDGGYENLADLGIDNPHMGKLGDQQIMWMNGSAPVQIIQPGNFSTDRPNVWGYFWNGGSPNVGSGLRLNGVEFFEPTTEATLVANSGYVDGLWTIGAYDGVETWNGLISEVILYDRNLAVWEKEKVESYLAIKYGNTLTHNYYAGDWNGSLGTTLWTVGGGYDNHIAGIGRDDCQGLQQKQSRSEIPGYQLTIGHNDQIATSNAAHTGSFSADGSFLMWGDNNGAISGTSAGLTAQVIATSVNAWTARKWKVVETGTVGSVKLRLPSLPGGFDGDVTFRMIIADDAGFTSNVSAVNMTQNGNYYEVNYDFNGTKYIAFGQLLPDSDSDSVVNLYDLDDDDDGIPDGVENLCPTLARWTNWTSVTTGQSATGSLVLNTGPIDVTYTSTQVQSIQTPGYFNLGEAYGGTLPNTNVEGLQAHHGAGLTHTYSFSGPVKDPILIFWSMNGNSFTFTQPFQLVGSSAGITTGGGNTVLIGQPGECNAAIKFVGTYTSISYTSSILEGWTGVTVGSADCNGNSVCSYYASWIDWNSVTAGSSATGTVNVDGSTVTATYTSTQVHSIQTPAYFNLGEAYNGYIPPSGTEGLQAHHGAGLTHTYSFSQPVTDPILVFWSMNGNTFTFTTPFELVGFSTGISTSGGNTVLTGYGGECNAAIRLSGTFSSISYTSGILEGWTGVNVGFTSCETVDTDGDGIANRLDLDSDGDGIPDNIEAQTTSGFVAPASSNTSNPNIGIPSNYAAGLIPIDTDSDGTPDYLDADTNGDEIPDVSQAGLSLGTFNDPDGDGLDNDVDTNDAAFGPANAGITSTLVAYPHVFSATEVDWRFRPAPGCVASGLKIWNKADAGISAADGSTIALWNNQADNSYPFTQSIAAQRPTYYFTTTSKLLNFNPTVDFDGTGDFIWNNTPLMPSSSAYTYLAVGTDEDAGTGFRKIFGAEAIVDYFGLYKQGGATGNNGWVPYAVGGSPDYGKMGKGTKYSASGGANGYWNGTNYTSNASTQSALPQIAGFMSVNSATSDPFFTWVDGYKENPGWSPIADGLVFRNQFHQIVAMGADVNSGGANFEHWKGRIPEFIAYDRQLTDPEMAQVNTYLAIKYGITLGQGNGHVGVNGNNYNYVSGNGTVIWTAAGNTAFGYDIAGIGRDYCQGLHQKQSQSVNGDDPLVIGRGNIYASNPANPYSLDNDASFLIWGNNNGSATTTTPLASNAPCGTPGIADARLNRIWRVQHTSNVGSVKMRLALPFNINSAIYMLIGTDPTMATWDQAIPMTWNGSNGELNYNFPSGTTKYITFAGSTTLPANICTGDKVIRWWDQGWTPGALTKNVTIGDQTFNFTISDPDNVRYFPAAFPRLWWNFLWIARYDQQENSAIEFKTTMSKPAREVEFVVNDVDGWVWGKDKIEITGKLGGNNVNAKFTVSKLPPGAFQITHGGTASNPTNPFTGSIYWLDTWPWARVYVTFDRPVDEFTINYKKDNLFDNFKVFNDLLIGDITVRCTNPTPPEPVVDNVYMYKTAPLASMFVNDTFDYVLTLKNLDCANKTIDINDALPATLKWAGNSLNTTLTYASANSYGGTQNLSIDDVVVPPGTSKIYIGAYGNTPGNYDNQAEFTVTSSGNSYVSDDPGQSGWGNPTPVTIVAQPFPDANFTVTKTADAAMVPKGTDVEYTFTFNNTTGSPVTVDFQDYLSDSLTYVAGSLMNTLGGTVSAYGGEGVINIMGMTLPTGASSIKISVSTSGVDVSMGDNVVPNFAVVTPSNGSGYMPRRVMSNTLNVTVQSIVDTDGDGVGNAADLDDDNDGILDTDEEAACSPSSPTCDTDGDGIINSLDLDSDNDGINDVREAGGTDANADGIADGTPDAQGRPVPAGLAAADTDGDGRKNPYDLDSDNDGISDLVESGNTGLADADNDGTVDGPDTDSDGIQNSADNNSGTFGDASDPTPVNTDGTDNPDYTDVDSDNDGLKDIAESGQSPLDTNNDGMVDSPTDPDGDGIANNGGLDTQPAVFGGLPVPDKDGDGIAEINDQDDDNDGILDTVEDGVCSPSSPACDTDGDGIPNRLDLDSDNDGINDVREANGTDANNDGIADGAPDAQGRPVPAGLTAPDTDGDGRKNPYDLDSDNDGISDLIESGAPGLIDANNNGVVDGTDADADGIRDSADGNDLAYGDSADPLPLNSEGIDWPDYVDTDSDNDGVMDIAEIGKGALDGDNDGMVDSPTDPEGDGIANNGGLDTQPGGFGGLPAPDKDADGVADVNDLDDDNDGILDTVEDGVCSPSSSNCDSDGDGVPNRLDLDSDNDGINDVREAGGTDTNNNGIADGTPDAQGRPVPGGLTPTDTDTDGKLNPYDLDSDNDGVSDLVESGTPGLVDADNNGVVDGPDNDGDGIRNSADNSPTFGDASDPLPGNTDGTDTPDYTDVDSDNNGVKDIAENGHGALDGNNDGMVDSPTDPDGDGIANNGGLDTQPAAFGGLPAPDKDGDGVSDASDLDDDNDGILDTTEDGICSPSSPSCDTDGDGIPNRLDLDSDNDGINDVREAGGTDANNDGMADGAPDAQGRPVPAGLNPPDTDGDGKKNPYDLDSDNDGIADLVESGATGFADADNNGVVDGPDADNDGIRDSADGNDAAFGDVMDPLPVNSDGTDNPDYTDTDSDNDSLNDIAETGHGALDGNNDGMVDSPADPDGDGIANNLALDTQPAAFGGLPAPDGDGDGTADANDLDDDNDGILDATEDGICSPASSNCDTDGDGTPNRLDLDSDNDGINDVREAGGTDANNNGIADGTPDAQGRPVPAGLTLADTDTDGKQNPYDLDADNDGISDLIESGMPGLIDADDNGVVDGPDADGDGIRDSADGNDVTFGDTSDPLPLNTDGADTPDYTDVDSDNDGVKDIVESGHSTLDGNNDGTVDSPTDPDGDGIANNGGLDTQPAAFGGLPAPDIDGDGVADANDLDDDNDGILDTVEEGICSPSSPTCDTDGDGIPNRLDLDSDNDGINDVREAGGTDANGDGIADGAPDAQGRPVPAGLNAPDTDSDGKKNPYDLDSDNDGLSDLYESGTPGLVDANDNGTVDGPDADGDGIQDSADGNDLANGDASDPLPVNTDGTDNPDYTDTDSNNNGVKDIAENGHAALDGNNDGMVDSPTDPEGDGIANNGGLDMLPGGFGGLPAPDKDGDGTSDTDDLDDDNDGILDTVEDGNCSPSSPACDTDGDGIPNRLDLDSDNDGINDVREAGGTDSNGDGIADGTPDAQGRPVPGGLNPADTDGDGKKNPYDLDADNDGISDLIESGVVGLVDADNNGVVDGPDTDGDGIRDSADGDDVTFGDASDQLPVNTDGVDSPDYTDVDSDNNGVKDIVETGNAALDGNNDGMVDGPTDPDGDGIANNGSLDTLPAAFGGLPAPDNDGDGTADANDLDDDNDGILDTVENGICSPSSTGCDTDGDGIPNRLDLDSDNDGINDVREASGTDANNNGIADGTPDAQGRPVPAGLTPPDTDGDGKKNPYDLDSDNDGISDLVEGGAPGLIDADNNGTVDGSDTDGDGIKDSADNNAVAFGDASDPLPTNTDGADNPDYTDTDSDNDGLKDIAEIGKGALDGNNDGMVDSPTDPDGDGIANNLALDTQPAAFGGLPAPDKDGDGVADNNDLDDDNDGILDTAEDDICSPSSPGCDKDGDGIPNRLDLDSDNDGINDVREAGGTDANGDGIADGTPDAQGRPVPAGLTPPDTDGDGKLNPYDLDSDNDGLSDLFESGTPGLVDANNNGVVDGPDADGDGIPDSADGNDAAFGDTSDPLPVNTDGADTPDYTDTDSDNDSVKDIAEAGKGALDGNNDGMVDSPTDPDGDGIANNGGLDTQPGGFGGLPAPDKDGDGVADANDQDDDNDGILDTMEDGICSPSSPNCDSDGDGVPNRLDLDSDNDGINDVREAGGTDTNGDGIADGTPDAQGRPVPAGLTPPDTDGDGKINPYDLDSDNDGLSDLYESGIPGLVDANNNGTVDGPDADGDGIQDSADGNDVAYGDATDPLPANTDGMDNPDYTDTDSNNNGVKDITETGNGALDGNNDGMVDSPTDPDGDGIANNGGLDTQPAAFGGLPTPDGDGDGVADANDLDDDNDGILDTAEDGICSPSSPSCDTDGDGIPNRLDLDSDNDGINDVREAGGADGNNDGISDGTPDAQGRPVPAGLTPPDTDGDGKKNPYDLDSDNDGISDLVESGAPGLIDTNDNGTVDGPDADGDGIQDNADGNDLAFGDASDPLPVNTDGTDVPDYTDTDSNNNGVKDIVETGNGALDGNNDGMVDSPTDPDGDGIANNGGLDTQPAAFGGLPAPDGDGDGVADANDLDDDNDGILDTVEDGACSPTSTSCDSDADGIPNRLDLDSDNDGINDVREAGGTDANGDGIADGTPDAQGAVVPGGLTPPDTDGDGKKNPYDLDSDNDGISDLVESGIPGLIDANNNGTVDGPDADGDGIQDSADGNDVAFGDATDPLPANTDGADTPDYTDTDSDNDGVKDIAEIGKGALDGNNDGMVDSPTDPDGDGIANNGGLDTQPGGFGGLPAPDKDGDGTVDTNDLDDDNDGILDTEEDGVCSPSSPNCDTDGDGIPNRMDLDSDNDGINDVREAGGTDANNDGMADGTPDGQGRPVPAGLTPPDTDGDGKKNPYDLDSDNDGVSDLVEGGAPGLVDANNNGTVDGPDADGDGIQDSADGNDVTFGDASDPLPVNSDGADTPDYTDPDSDNDGIKDIAENGNGALDGNNDGMVDSPTDPDGDGIANNGGLDTQPAAFGGLSAPDADNDGVADANDLDDDNDGILDTVEDGICSPSSPGCDSDGDGIPNRLDLDSDNDGINDVREAGGTDANGDGIADGTPDAQGAVVPGGLTPPDTDGDGKKNPYDLDSDNDGVSDLVESGIPGLIDANNNGMVDGPDADGDGIPDSADGNDLAFGDASDPAPANTDGADTPDYTDTDSDNDGVKDIAETGNGALDGNNDGMVDSPTDPDGDGIANNGGLDTQPATFGGLPAPDGDGDGVADANDLDDDNDGILDAVEDGICSPASINCDSDGDGIPNRLDLDSDNDGINDVREAGGADANGDGIADGAPDAQGRPVPGGLTPPDTDSDGKKNPYDLDSDNDGFSDLYESGTPGLVDANNNGMVDGPDADADGIQDSADGNDVAFGDASDPLPANTDGTDNPDYTDTDSDNDGLKDITEGGNGALDGNNDGMVDSPTDPDGDGIANNGGLDTQPAAFGGLPTPDADGDGVADADDLDDDNDGILDTAEDGVCSPSSPNCDTDVDGIPNRLDLDSDNDGINDVREAGGTDANGDGIADGTPDAQGRTVPGGLTPPDTDGDGKQNPYDLDSDNDGISDLVESGTPGLVDANNNGTVDGPDADGDGIQDSADGNDAAFGDASDPLPANTDGADSPNYTDTDSDNDGLKDILETGNGTLDSNNDGMVDSPTDPDGDGVANNGGLDTAPTGFGGLQSPDADNDGVADAADQDDDNDGILDTVEDGICSPSTPTCDSDGDGIPNRLDLDSDNDGINDVREAGGTDANNDGIADGTPDPQGRPVPVGLTPPDTDSDSKLNPYDLDSDNDGISDLVESDIPGLTDANDNGMVDGPDADGDGIQDSADGNDVVFGDASDPLPANTDGMDNPDYTDTDSDNDTTFDIAEGGHGTLDGNNDGMVDSPTDPDGDGVANNGGLDTQPAVFGGLPAPVAAVALTSKVFLGGAYNDAQGLMQDSLRAKGLVPLNQPYNTLTDYNYNGTETVNASVFTTTGPNAIVDWVFVELRDQNDPTVSLYKRAGLVQRDGDIVDVDGVSPLTFTGAGTNSYYVSVRHRNHLGVMTQAPVAFGVTPPVVDFTLGTTLNYQLSGPTGSSYAQQLWPSSKLSLWPGNMSNQPAAPDPHTGDRVIYQGPAADVEDAYFAVLLDPANTSFLPVHVVDPIYSRADANMDGKVIYQGSNADPDVTFFTVFLFPDNTSVLPIFKVFEQIPK